MDLSERPWQSWYIFVCPKCFARVNSGEESPPLCGMHFPEEVRTKLVEVVPKPTRGAVDREEAVKAMQRAILSEFGWGLALSGRETRLRRLAEVAVDALPPARGGVSPELVRDLGSAWRADDGAAIALAIARLENAAGLSEQGDPPPTAGAFTAVLDEEDADG
jgi:hypothetical protein